MVLTAKMIHPSSELATSDGYKRTSGVGMLYNPEDHLVSRYRFYKVATMAIDNLGFVRYSKIYTSLYIQPSSDLKKIYAVLNFKERPFMRKSNVVIPQ